VTKNSKINILDAYDALKAVESARIGIGARGKGRRCDACNHQVTTQSRHPRTCPIGIALAALELLIPPERDAWLFKAP